MKKIIVLFMFSALFTACDQTAGQATEKPNVVIVFIDDEGYGDVGCYGATGFETPNLDQMASKGMRFTNFYAAQPVCSLAHCSRGREARSETEAQTRRDISTNKLCRIY